MNRSMILLKLRMEKLAEQPLPTSTGGPATTSTAPPVDLTPTAKLAAGAGAFGRGAMPEGTAQTVSPQTAYSVSSIANEAVNAGKGIAGLLSSTAGGLVRSGVEQKFKDPSQAGEFAGQMTKSNPGMLTGGASSDFKALTKDYKATDWLKFGANYLKTDPAGAMQLTKEWMKAHWPMLAAGGIGLVGMYALLNRSKGGEEAPQPAEPFRYRRLMGLY